jgi:hypothetical protein
MPLGRIWQLCQDGNEVRSEDGFGADWLEDSSSKLPCGHPKLLHELTTEGLHHNCRINCWSLHSLLGDEVNQGFLSGVPRSFGV